LKIFKTQQFLKQKFTIAIHEFCRLMTTRRLYIPSSCIGTRFLYAHLKVTLN